jgi:hypothetical protein
MKLKNRLDQFRSHSVHYVVIAARSTEDVRAFTDGSADAQTRTLQAIEAAKQLGDEIVLPGKSSSNVAFLMLDTRRFSQFTIDNFSLETVIDGFRVPGSTSPHVTGTNMTFTVTDNVGISFANFLQYLMDQKLQVSYDGMTLLVRLLFIGHLSDGSSQVVQSVTVPAIFNKIELELTDTKGVYNCTLFPLIGMSSTRNMNARWTSIGNAVTYFTGKGANTLGAMVASFEKSLNKESLKRYAQLNAQTQQPGKGAKQGTRYGRPVQYMITIPKTWETYRFSGPAQGSAVEINFAELLKEEEARRQNQANQSQQKNAPNASAPARDTYLSVDPDWTITDVLDKMFAQTGEVSKLANFSTVSANTPSIKFYKQLVSVTSDNEAFTVHVDVVEFEIPNVELATKTTTVSQQDEFMYQVVQEPGRAPRKEPRNFIELDYIFSGKNMDVLSLDLKIENLNIMLMQGVKIGSGELEDATIRGQDQPNGEGVGADRRTVQGMRQKDPLLMPQMTALQRNNFSDIGTRARDESNLTPQEVNQQYVRNLSAFYNAGPVTAKLVLRGNPDIMAGVTLQDIQQHVTAVTVTAATGEISSTNTSVKAKYRADLEKSLLGPGITRASSGAFRVSNPLSGPSPMTSPVFVKVNVFGPNVNFVTNAPIAGQDFAQQLFYQNFYFLQKLTSKIEGSKFTQELDLLSYSVYGYTGWTAQGPQANVRPQEAK